MRRLSTIILSVAIVLAIAATAFAFGGKSPKKTTPKKPGEIFGILPWESKDSVLAKNLVIGIESIEINEENATFNDLIDRELYTPPPDEVTYFFTGERVYRIHLVFTGNSAPYKTYSGHFWKIYGSPVTTESKETVEMTWKLDKFLLNLTSNHKAEMKRQLRIQKSESDKIIVTMDIIFTPPK